MTSHHQAPKGNYQSRRERHTALAAPQRVRFPAWKSPPTKAPPTRAVSARLAVLNLKAVVAFVAISLLLTTYLLPAYAPSVLQSLSVTGNFAPEQAPRDQYLVTRTTLAGYQPFEHLADTFANNPNSSVQWPFAVGVPVSSWFGYRSCAGCSSDHQGIDFNPGEGTPIQAIADGIVTEVGNPNGSFGVYARISHQIDGQNITSLYAHMLEGSLALEVGDTVDKGQLVGQVGNSGQSTGAHLHFGIYLDGVTAIDPYAWLKEKVGS